MHLTPDPTMHGEITAIRKCTEVLTERGLSPQEILAAWKQFSLYTNGEPCPMCASAIRWAGFKEVIYGSSIRTIAQRGFKTLLWRVPIADVQTGETRYTSRPAWCGRRAILWDMRR